MKRITRRIGESIEFVDGQSYAHLSHEQSTKQLFKTLAEYEDANEPRHIEEWHEDYGDCLFWKFPIEEPPYCGSPLDSNFVVDYFTHFTRLMMPIGIE